MPWDDEPERAPLNAPGVAMVVSASRAGAGSGWHFTPALGDWIAELLADHVSDERPHGMAGGLWGIHHAFPERVPPPSTVRAWARQFPAFGLQLREAERLRAERLMEETLVIADTDPAAPPRVALRIAARQHFAEKLDRQRYGNGASGNSSDPLRLGQDAQPVALDVSDEELAALALAGRDDAAGG